MLRFIFLAVLLQVSSAQAFLIATYNSENIDYSKETDVIVIGYAGELGNGFLMTAMTYANKTNEQFPNRQIVFYAENRLKDKTSSKYFKALGAPLISFDDKPFTTDKLMKELLKFEKIHTLHVVAHGALENGAGLTDQVTGGRWNHKTPGLSNIRFTDDGYIILHGCNTGFLQAPEFSRQMGVPAFGSLTATNFQRVFDDGEWYFNDVGLYPEDVSFLKSNYVAFSEPRDCAQGACHRLKADYFSYNGFWGDFSGGGGLSFYKSFCTFDVKSTVKNQMCLSAMRQFMQIFPSHVSLSSQPSLEDYKAVVKDFLCGIRLGKNLREECYAKLEEAETNPNLTYAGFTGNPLRCKDFGACEVTYKCNNSGDVHKCVLDAKANNKPTTILDEYRNYLLAF